MDAPTGSSTRPATLEATRRYFENGGTPGCKAGLRFLVVTADGSLQPCSMQFKRYPLDEQARMVERVHRAQHLRRVLRLDPFLPGQGVPAVAARKRQRLLLVQVAHQSIG